MKKAQSKRAVYRAKRHTYFRFGSTKTRNRRGRKGGNGK